MQFVCWIRLQSGLGLAMCWHRDAPAGLKTAIHKKTREKSQVLGMALVAGPATVNTDQPLRGGGVKPENRSITEDRASRGRFRKGVSGNPGGRPKSMTSAILDRCPNASADIMDFRILVAFGSAAVVKERYGVEPRMHDRLAAASELADRLYGKPVQAVDIDDERRDVPVFIMPPDTHIAIN